jgi:hypothetical protein
MEKAIEVLRVECKFRNAQVTEVKEPGGKSLCDVAQKSERPHHRVAALHRLGRRRHARGELIDQETGRKTPSVRQRKVTAGVGSYDHVCFEPKWFGPIYSCSPKMRSMFLFAAGLIETWVVRRCPSSVSLLASDMVGPDRASDLQRWGTLPMGESFETRPPQRIARRTCWRATQALRGLRAEVVGQHEEKIL